MHRSVFAALAFTLLLSSAHASVTYYWHQTDASPGLRINGRYTLVDPAIAVMARSDSASIDLSNLSGLDLQAQWPTQWWPRMTRADLVYICYYYDPGCVTGPITSWLVNIHGDLPYMQFEGLPDKWFYRVTASWIGLDYDPYGPNPIYYGADGYWSTEAVYVSAPQTLAIWWAGLALLAGLRLPRRAKP